jgi:hypothetical protein
MIKWMDRAVFVSPIFYALCTTEKAFYSQLRKMKIPKENWPPFLPQGADACTHMMETEKHAAAIVCMQKERGQTKRGYYSLLVHESVHVWQRIREDINEDRPSSEFEAYSIQQISLNLMEAWDKQ